MKQYTTPEQTAKLIELGFDKPKSKSEEEVKEILKVIAPLGDFEIPISNSRSAYSIGELIEMLPQVIDIEKNGLLYSLRILPTLGGGWAILYYNEYDERNNELIDALYYMIIKLKAEGVI